MEHEEFLAAFSGLGCYLVDLCGRPVDRLERKQRVQVCRDGEGRLAQTIKRLRPEVIVTMVRSIAENVRRAELRAEWDGARVELPYPGRWKRNRVEFEDGLRPVLRERLKSTS